MNINGVAMVTGITSPAVQQPPDRRVSPDVMPGVSLEASMTFTVLISETQYAQPAVFGDNPFITIARCHRFASAEFDARYKVIPPADLARQRSGGLSNRHYDGLSAIPETR